MNSPAQDLGMNSERYQPGHEMGDSRHKPEISTWDRVHSPHMAAAYIIHVSQMVGVLTPPQSTCWDMPLRTFQLTTPGYAPLPVTQVYLKCTLTLLATDTAQISLPGSDLSAWTERDPLQPNQKLLGAP